MIINEAIENTNPIILIPPTKYDSFCKGIENKIKIPNLDIFKDEMLVQYISEKCGELFNEEIKIINSLLENTKIGIAALDIPETTLFDKSTDSILGVAVVIGIFNNIAKSIIDPINSTPFTLHTASHSSGKLLASTEHTPDAKLGYHNDGIAGEDKLKIPKNIVLYNLYIGYRNPGNFKWIPTDLWEAEKYFSETIKTDLIKINIKLTPYFNLKKDNKLNKSELGCIETPISSILKNEKRRYFLNGKVTENNNDPKNIELIQIIRNSLENNPVNISIAQKERRAIYIRNTSGFHARDVFEEPFADIDLTRVFVRSVDVDSEIYPSIKINVEEVNI